MWTVQLRILDFNLFKSYILHILWGQNAQHGKLKMYLTEFFPLLNLSMTLLEKRDVSITSPISTRHVFNKVKLKTSLEIQIVFKREKRTLKKYSKWIWVHNFLKEKESQTRIERKHLLRINTFFLISTSQHWTHFIQEWTQCTKKSMLIL